MGASVLVTLDTQPPDLTVVAGIAVVPPEPWSVRVTSNEVIGTAAAALHDSRMTLTMLGIEQVDARTLVVLVPTVEVSSGPAGLMLKVTDEVGNAAVLTVPVLVDRPDGFTVDFSLDPAFDIDEQVARAFDAVLEAAGAWDIMPEITAGFGIDYETAPAYAVLLEVS